MPLGVKLFWIFILGLAGYLEAKRFRKQYGRSPFGWDPITWGIVCGLAFIVGVILIAIGERIQRNKGMVPQYGMLADGSPAQGQHVPGYQVPIGYAPPPGFAPAQYAPPPAYAAPAANVPPPVYAPPPAYAPVEYAAPPAFAPPAFAPPAFAPAAFPAAVEPSAEGASQESPWQVVAPMSAARDIAPK